MAQRPKTIPVVAGFLFAAAAIATAVGISLLFPGGVFDWLWKLNKSAEVAFRTMGSASIILLLFLAAGTCAAGAGLLQRKKWAWWFSVLLFALNAIGDIVNLVVTGDWPRSVSGVIICATFLGLLTSHRVRSYFKREP